VLQIDYSYNSLLISGILFTVGDYTSLQFKKAYLKRKRKVLNSKNRLMFISV